MLLLSIAAWCIVVYSLRVAFLGNPLHVLLMNSDSRLLKRAETFVKEGHAPAADDPAADLLRKFSRLTMLELGAFVLEMVLLIAFALSRMMTWLCIILIIKNIAFLAVSIYYARMQTARGNLFESLRNLPPLMMRLDRISACLSGAAFIVLFTALNGLFT